MEEGGTEPAGERHERFPDKFGYRLGPAFSRFDYRGGKVPLDWPRVRDKTAGKEIRLTTWENFSFGEFLQEWVATRWR